MRGCNDVYTVITCIMNMSSLCSDPSYTCTCIHIGVCTCAVYSVCSFVCTCTNVLLHVGTLCCTCSYCFCVMLVVTLFVSLCRGCRPFEVKLEIPVEHLKLLLTYFSSKF